MDVVEYLITDFWERPLPELTPRDVHLPEISGRADVVIGMRRSGKTFLLMQEMRRLLAEGTSKQDLLYLNIEDDRLAPLEPGLLDRVLETFFRLNPGARDRTSCLLLDEIQAAPGWERFIRRVLDTENVRIYLSGSSAKMLSTEVASVLRGRGIRVEVLPFSLSESIRHAGIALPQVWPPGAPTRSKIEAHLRRYLDIGGFPEVQNLAERDRIRILQDYVELVLLRDVIERHGIENATAAKRFTRRLLQSVARPFSVNSVYNDFRSLGIRVSKDTLHALLEHLSDAFLVFPINVFRRSFKARQVNPRKIYAIDPGLVRAMSHVAAVDYGVRLENMVYLELRRRLTADFDGAISYYTTAAGREVDFVVGDPDEGSVKQLIQVCASIKEPGTREREVRALAEAMGELGLTESVVVTLHDEETVETDCGTVRIVPAWRWVLQPD
jgi:predicted AAA+ superfamily ATPase